MGAQPQPIPPIYDVNVAVEAIFNAAEGDLRDVYVGGAGKLLSVIERISPAALDFTRLFKEVLRRRPTGPSRATRPTTLMVR